VHSDRVVELFGAFRDALQDPGIFGEFAEFVELPSDTTHRIDSMAFVSLAREHVRELTNSVNGFALYVSHLRAWEGVLESLDEPERHEAMLEMVNPLVYFCLSAPYAIRNRFIRSAGLLSHQANRFHVPGWKDTGSLSKVNFKTAQKLAASWPTWGALAEALEGFNSEAFQEAVGGLRHEFHHDFPRSVELGIQLTVEREVLQGSVRYGFGVRDPLPLGTLVSALSAESEASMRVRRAYIDLVREQYECVHDACRVDD
jgi:hypothetical protein